MVTTPVLAVSRGYNWWTEDLHGLRVGCPKDGQGRPFGRCPTQFPEANLLGCSFNSSLFSLVAEACGPRLFPGTLSPAPAL